MKMFTKTLLLVSICLAPAMAALAQDNIVTSEAIGPLNGSLTVNFPPDPCSLADNVTLTGNVHVVVQVNTATNTMDVHINLMTVKGTGNYGKYIGNGATSFADLPFNPSQALSFSADLWPPDPCRAGFTKTGALPLVIIVTLGTDNTVNEVAATTAQPNS